ncbi:MAG TPA: hypothetical protein VGJ77_03625 [Gaiellaceae bacterium]
MRVAALYDVHGNAYALEAVLAEVGDVDKIVFGAIFIRGNADVLASPAVDERWTAARRWVAAQLSAEQIAWLGELPFSWSADGALYVHANPVDVNEFVTPRTPESRVAELLNGVAEAQVVTGHVHVQFEREVGAVRWIGAGSVGKPYEPEGGAYWVLVDEGAVDFRRTDYDVERADAAILASGHPVAADCIDRASGWQWFASAS